MESLRRKSIPFPLWKIGGTIENIQLIACILSLLQVTGIGYLAASYDLFNILFLVSRTNSSFSQHQKNYEKSDLH